MPSNKRHTFANLLTQKALTMFAIESFDFRDKKALIRVDFNVPLKDGNVSDNTRIKAALPSINKVLEGGGSVILMSHLGRPKGVEKEFSLSQIVGELSSLLGKDVVFSTDCVGPEALNAMNGLGPGEVLLLENLRFHPEEKAGDRGFAQQLSGLADVYINDAFGTAHRAHASTAVIAEFMDNKMPGYLLETEVKNAAMVLNSSERPFTAIVGGAKVSSKITVLQNLLSKVDDLIIGGGMAYTFIKAMGGDVGSSLVEEEYLSEAEAIVIEAGKLGVNIHLPEDSVLADEFSATANTNISDSNRIPEGWMGLDVGPLAVSRFKGVVMNSATILWNGPMGVFEMEAFSQGTLEIARAVARATQEKGAYSLIGGGDSVAAINKFGLSEKVSYISTGGGAMLEYLEGKSLPGISAVMQA